MTNYVSGVNPEVLRWAREKAGLSIEDIAQSFHKDVEVISNWESGMAVPTYNQLEKLAYSLYKRPIALFFFPSPPDEPDPGKSFRTLPDIEVNRFHSDTLLAIREANARQLTLYELLEGVNPSEKQIFKDIQIHPSLNPNEVALAVREYLGVSLEEQFKWGKMDDALKNWRNIIEENGIFIFKRSFKQGDISGFCLADNELPVIYLNNSTAKSRQIFSIFHELTHVLLSTSGITKSNDTYIGYLSGTAKAVEIFCNRFAGEFLVPSFDFEQRLDLNQQVEDLVKELSKQYSVSREVILRKLLDRNIVSTSDYEKYVREWLEDYEKAKSKKSHGGDYFATQATYFGQKFLNLIFSKYYSGSLTIQEVAGYMDIRAKNVAGVEPFVS